MANKIAIIGYACRLPGQVSTPDDLWELCTRRRNGWSEIPKGRFSFDAFYHPNPSKPGSFNPKGGYFLQDDITKFDASFFNLTEKEAISLDPQQRLLLECTFEALESGGIPKEQIAGRNVGVYVGGNFSDYELMNVRDVETIPMHQATGCAPAMQSNRISYFFDLRGPSMTFDTACSGSLVALHHAVRSLTSGESTEAVVAGCRMNILPDYFISMSMSQLFNDTGKTFAFDERADSGFARGEGAGVVILKPLEAALRDRDSIRAVICSTGVGQDGRTQGITNPNGEAQRDLITKVYERAGLDPRDCGFAEMHGTGTKVGDPIEASAVHQALSYPRARKDPLYIGSVKSNVGHLEGASGVVSVIKAAMMLEKELVLPNTNFRNANPGIPLEDWNMKVLTSTRPWPRNKKYVSVSNYGFGGTNAHAVLEKPPREARQRPGPVEAGPADPGVKLFVISANDKESLQTRMKDLGIYFEQRPEAFEKNLCPNVAYTLGCRRSHLGYRVAIAAPSLDELGTKIARTRLHASRVVGKPKIGYVFTGQGAQWAQMGMGLMQWYPVFAETITRADSCLRKLGSEFSLLEELQNEPGTSRVNSPHVSQPACTAVQIGLVNLFKSWGIQPASVVGHSSGEIAAAYAAGALDEETAMALAYYRGSMTSKLKEMFPMLKGGMIAVGVSSDAVKPYINKIKTGYATVACINSPSSVTVSGDEAAVVELHEMLDREGIFNRLLKIDVAYHSNHMSRVSQQYLTSISDRLPASSLSAAFFSSVYSRPVDAVELAPSYWVSNLVSAVLFSSALEQMCSGEQRPDFLIEIGPHSALKGPVKETLKALGPSGAKIIYSSSLVRNTDAVESVLEAAGSAYSIGATLDMVALNFPATLAQTCSMLTDMPRYPWQHSKSYWHESRISQKHSLRDGKRNDLLGVAANYSNDLEPTWRNVIRLDDIPWLRHHKMQGMPVFPFAGYLAMAIEASHQRAISQGTLFDSFELREVIVSSALVLSDGVDTETTITLRPYNDASRGYSDTWNEFKICSWDPKRGWAEHCRGLVCVADSKKQSGLSIMANVGTESAALRKRAKDIELSATQQVDEVQMYNALDTVGAGYGSTFQGLRDCYVGAEQSRGNIYVQDTRCLMPKRFESELVIHPSFLDAFLHLTWPILGACKADFNTLYMPTTVRSVRISREVVGEPGEFCHVWCNGSPNLLYPKPTVFEICATRFGDTGQPVIKFDGFVMTPIRDSGTVVELHAKKICFKSSMQPLNHEAIDGEPNIQINGNNSSEMAVANGVELPKSNGVNGIPAVKYPGLRQSDHVNGVNHASNDERPNQNGHDHPESVPVKNITPEIGMYHGVPGDTEISVVRFGESDEAVNDLVKSIDMWTGILPSSHALTDIDYVRKRVVLLQCGPRSLRDISAVEFSNLKQILLDAAQVIWVYPQDAPESAMSVGLARTVRSENMSAISMVGVEASEFCSAQPSRLIMKALDTLWFTEHSEPIKDTEFIFLDGQIHVPRIEEDDMLNDFISNETTGSTYEIQPYHQSDRRLKIQIGNYGALDTIHFVDDYIGKLGDQEVELEVKATGVNFKDIVVCMGQVSQPYIGVECSGIVSAVGKNVSHIKVGQRVMAMTEGAYSSYARCLGTSAFPIDDEMTFEEAATIPVVFCTAYYGLFDLGRLAKGERVLIHAAAGGVGQAAIMLAQMAGAEIYATVGSLDKKRFLTSKYDIPEHRIFFSRDTTFGAGIKSATSGTGVDVVLNSLAGEMMRESWDCLAPFGRFIEIGKADITRNSRLDMMKFEYNCTFASVDLTKVASYKPELMQRLLSEVYELIRTGIISPISPVRTYSISETELAFRALQSGKAMGKLVVVPYEGDTVLATRPKVGSNILHPNGTYILVGGTGGLGRSIAKWMSTKGARDIVLISRSASLNEKTETLINELALAGTKVTLYQCDVSKKSAVEKLVLEDLKHHPPIRGVIHGAMVLRDMLFEQMTLEDFNAVISCKVEGVTNLHEVLQDPRLDFFVALSSVAGIVGNRGQAAYAAANVFLDDFMRFRRSQKLPGISIDLAAVSNVGYLADGSESRRREVLKNIGGQTVDESEVLALLAAAVTGKMEQTCQGHCITGLATTDEDSFWLSDSKFTTLRRNLQAREPGNHQSGQAISLAKVLRTAPSKEEASQALYEALAAKITAVLVMPADAIEPSHTLKSLGLDSLVAIEIRNWIARETEVNVQVLELLSSGSIISLVELILKKMEV